MLFTERIYGQLKKGFLSGSALKWIAVAAMVVDHLAAVVLKGYVRIHLSQFSEVELAELGRLYDWMRRIGRTAFPLFAFLLTEGFFHTRNRKKYALRLFVFALLSEIPYDLAVFGRICERRGQNTLFTLLLGLALMGAAEWIRLCAWRRSGGEGKSAAPGWPVFLLQSAVFAAGAVATKLCRLDYGYRGIGLIGVFYLFYAYRTAAAAAGFCLFCASPWSLPAFLLIPCYNGRRGKKGRGRRWFYLFYPLHLLVLYGIVVCCA